MTNTRRTNDASGTVSNFIVLTPRKLHEELRYLVFYLHLTQDRCPVVRDGDLPIW